MTGDDFRDLALSQFDAIEGAHMGHPDFRVNGRIFASLNGPETRGMVVLTPEQQKGFVKAEPKVYEIGPGAWGRQGCTWVVLAQAKEPSVQRALKSAWTNVSQKKAAKKSAKKTAVKLAKKSASKKARKR